MVVFYLTIVTVFIFSLLARITRKRYREAGVFFVLIVIIILVLVSGLRSGIGDTYMYKYLYGLLGPGYSSNGAYEKGFILFLKILKRISEDSQFLIMVTSIIVNVFNIGTIYKYTKDSYFELGTYMYIASGYYIVTMNGIRQSMVASIIFAATIFIIKGKFKTYLVIILLMSTIHTSVLIMIPLYFICRVKAWEKTTNILFALTFIGVILFQPIMNVLIGMLGSSRYSGYATFNEGGASIVRIAVFAVPVILTYIKRDEVREWEGSNVFVNMNIICFIIMVFSSFNWIFARFTIYLQLYSFILLPYIVKNCLRRKEIRLIYSSLIVCYFIFFYYDQAITMGMVYKSEYNLENFFYSMPVYKSDDIKIE